MPNRREFGPRLPRDLLHKVAVSDESQKSPRRLRVNHKVLKRRQHAHLNTRQFDDKWAHDAPREVSSHSTHETQQGDEYSRLKYSAVSPSTLLQEPTKTEENIVDTGRSKKRQRLSKDHNEEPLQVSLRVKAKLAQDDDEITKLEKKLGLKSKRLPKSFDDDGLGDLLGDLNDTDFIDHRLERDVDKANGRLHAHRGHKRMKSSDDGRERVLENNMFLQPSNEDVGGIDSKSEDSESAADDEGSDLCSSADTNAQSKQQKTPSSDRQRQRENPYIPPIPSQARTEKYVPPSRRAASDNEAPSRIRTRIQGSLNKLSESNLISITNEIEKLYENSPRQSVNVTILELLLNLMSDSTALSLNFLALHAAFTTALYRIKGPDFGAQCIEKVVKRVNDCRLSNVEPVTEGKQLLNLITFLTYLYSFGLVNCVLIFDYIRSFLLTLSEGNTELLLRIARSCGHQLRQDDPTALKDIAFTLQKQIGSNDQVKVSIRTRFMIEEITKLKDNHLKHSNSGTINTVELVSRYRKTLGLLVDRNLRATQPLSLSLQDIQKGDGRGEWWVGGARYPHQSEGRQHHTSATTIVELEAADGHEESPDFRSLARQQRMNTTIRRSIFTTLMSSSDYIDAYRRLLKLDLKRSQQQQIPNVLLHCVGTESSFNRYYLLVAQKLCENKKLAKAFEYALLELLRRLSSSEMEEEDDNGRLRIMAMAARVNYAKLYGELVSANCVGIVALKGVDLRRAEGRTKDFVELMLVTALSHMRNENLQQVFSKIPATGVWLEGLRWFVKNVLIRTDLLASEGDTKRLRRRCKVVMKVLSEPYGDL